MTQKKHLNKTASRKRKPRAVFAGVHMKSSNLEPEAIAFGFIKPEGDRWAAVCVNLCIVAQGDSPTQAFEKMMDSAQSYISFLKQQYPQDWQLRLESESPKSFIREFRKILDQLQPMIESMAAKSAQRRTVHFPTRSTLMPTIIPGNVFVQPISAHNA